MATRTMSRGEGSPSRPGSLERPLRAAIYARVSTEDKGQDPAVQVGYCRQLCDRLGWTVEHVYTDYASAGDFGRRAEWAQLLRDAEAGRFDVLVVYRIDRAFRSVLEGAIFLDDSRRWNVAIRSMSEPHIDTTGPHGEAMYHQATAWASLERQVLAERIRDGMDHAHRHGTKSGRAIGRPRVEGDSERLLSMVDSPIRSLSAQANSMKMARETFRRRMGELGYSWSSDAMGWVADTDGSRGEQRLMATNHLTEIERATAARERLDTIVQEHCGVTLAQMVVVNEIARLGPRATVTELGAILGRRSHTMTGTINALQEHGYVRRRDGDGRSKPLELTPAAVDLLAGWEGKRADVLALALGRLDDPLPQAAQLQIEAQLRVFGL